MNIRLCHIPPYPFQWLLSALKVQTSCYFMIPCTGIQLYPQHLLFPSFSILITITTFILFTNLVLSVLQVAA